ncbi:hypothetical protein [Kribbella sp. NPDC006257]|uniref:beta family protein n=1 Tax=Kribbella sp. NPDC006257 TaxID=3156738 RepID=UPI00339E3E6C
MFEAGDFDALVALRAKQGELWAVEALREVGRVQPLLQFDGDVDGQLQNVEKVARKLHALGRLVMVDAVGPPGSLTFAGEDRGGLGALADRLSGEDELFGGQIPFVPVARGDLPASRIGWIGRLGSELGAGGAIRVGAAWATAEDVGRVVDLLELEVGQVDLIVDLEYVDSCSPQLVEWALGSFAALEALGAFRSMTILSGSVPSALDQTSLWERPRFEEEIWRGVVEGGGREIRLGDYGVVHPGVGAQFPSKHVTLKYTCSDHWLFVRERMSGEMGRGPTLRVVCSDLVQSGSFSGAQYSWGDGEIASAADGRGSSLGSTSKPVAIGTSHHLAYLASLSAA